MGFSATRSTEVAVERTIVLSLFIFSSPSLSLEITRRSLQSHDDGSRRSASTAGRGKTRRGTFFAAFLHNSSSLFAALRPFSIPPSIRADDLCLFIRIPGTALVRRLVVDATMQRRASRVAVLRLVCARYVRDSIYALLPYRI